MKNINLNIIYQKAVEIRNKLKKYYDDDKNPIYMDLDPIRPYIGGSKIKAIVIGQDPTVKSWKSRIKIQVTLNLDKKNALTDYINKIVPVNLIYATNLFKYFYTCPPSNTFEILEKHLPQNLYLLMEELSYFPNVPVITLGELVLKLLSKNKELSLKEYWGYNKITKKSTGNFKFCKKEDSKIKRDFFPFPHQPSLKKGFYKDTLESYIKFFRTQSKF